MTWLAMSTWRGRRSWQCGGSRSGTQTKRITKMTMKKGKMLKTMRMTRSWRPREEEGSLGPRCCWRDPRAGAVEEVATVDGGELAGNRRCLVCCFVLDRSQWAIRSWNRAIYAGFLSPAQPLRPGRGFQLPWRLNVLPYRLGNSIYRFLERFSLKCVSICE